MVFLPKFATSVPRPALLLLECNAKRQTAPGKRACKCVHTRVMVLVCVFPTWIQDPKKRAISVIMCCPPSSSSHGKAVSLAETSAPLNWSWHVILLRLQLRRCAHGCFVPAAFTFWKINVQIYFQLESIWNNQRASPESLAEEDFPPLALRICVLLLLLLTACSQALLPGSPLSPLPPQTGCEISQFTCISKNISWIGKKKPVDGIPFHINPICFPPLQD